MKIYIASSWKQRELCIGLAQNLRSQGHEVDCFCDESTGRFVFSYAELPNYETMNAIEFLEHDKPQKAFAEDKKWIDWADVVIMLKPCGNSAHLEAGYAKGTGKKLIIFGAFPFGDFDVMYGFADRMFRFTEQSELMRYLEED